MSEPLEKAAEVLVVGLAQTGDSAAFAELVRRRQSWLRNLLNRLCNDAALADDFAQAAFLDAWRDIVHLREAQKFPGWLKRIAVNVWLKHQRKQDPLRHASSTDQQPPMAHRERPEIAMDLDQALATLAPEPRLCIVLSYHEGMTHSEIATLLDMPAGTVKSHIRRGTRELRSLLMAYGEEHAT